MIILSEVATKIQNILNGTDNEITGFTNPTDFYYVVETQGFHLDRLDKKTIHKDFIPVFVSSMGGAFNPVQNLGEANYTIPITFYFPVRLKESFFLLNQFLANILVGGYLTWGTISGKAVSNISVSQYGEIQDLDLKQFGEWVNQVYDLPIDIMQPYMSMTFTLYLSTSNSSFVYGNDVSATLTYNGYTGDPESVVFADTSIQSNAQVSSQQGLGEYQSEALPFGVGYGSGFSVYVKNNNFFKKLIGDWFNGEAQTMTFTLNMTFATLGLTYSISCFMQSANLIVKKGSLMTITFAFTKLIS